MKKYIVGGFCRDRIMNLTPNDKDYVLVDCTPKDVQRLLEQGFQMVGKSFPVYLSPGGEEYALARIERKNGSGYNGFECETANVTLQDDLYRRDLTINAIAWDPVLKRYVDPYGGQKDIQNKVLRHVSPAFAEDPLRVLRLARFGARFADFTIHGDTLKMVDTLVKSGELNTLTPERVTIEFTKAMGGENFVKFLEYLEKFKVLDTLIPGIRFTKEMKSALVQIEKTCTPAYKNDMYWAVLLDHADLDESHSYSAIRLTLSTAIFCKKTQLLGSDIRTFRSMKPENMTVLFNRINARNNGGEEHLIKILEYFVVMKFIDIDLEHLIMLAFDKYSNVVLPDIERMVQDNELQKSEIGTFVNTLRTKNISALFAG